jgi:O-6-methylguanine DNA methyltransferase
MERWHLVIETGYKPIVISGKSDIITRVQLIKNRLKESEELLKYPKLSNSKFSKRLVNSFRRYFNSERVKFNFKIYLEGYTELEMKVLKIVKNIPFGILMSYKQVAIKVKNKNYARYVGNVLAKNRFPIIIPCHRVIKSSGEIGNFSPLVGWKQFLINLESII